MSPSPTYSWERAGVRVISSAECVRLVQSRTPTFEITLTLTLSHDYMGEGTKSALCVIVKAFVIAVFRSIVLRGSSDP